MSVPNLRELKRCLQDAGLYEDNMTAREMQSFYDVIKSSETTASKEDQQRSVDCTMESVPSSSGYSSTKNGITHSNDDDSDNINKTFDDSTTDYQSFKDNIGLIIKKLSPSNPHQSFKSTLDNHQQHQLSISNKADFIKGFHRDEKRILYKKAKKAEYSPENLFVLTNTKKNIEKSSSLEKIDHPVDEEVSNTYISQSGRATKRKLYNECNVECMEKKRIKKKDDGDYKQSTGNKKQSGSAIKHSSLNANKSTKRGNGKNKKKVQHEVERCNLCREFFTEDELDEHASTCGQ